MKTEKYYQKLTISSRVIRVKNCMPVCGQFLFIWDLYLLPVFVIFYIFLFIEFKRKINRTQAKYRICDVVHQFNITLVENDSGFCGVSGQEKLGSGRRYHYIATKIWSETGQFVNKKNYPVPIRSQLVPKRNFLDFTGQLNMTNAFME